MPNTDNQVEPASPLRELARALVAQHRAQHESLTPPRVAVALILAETGVEAVGAVALARQIDDVYQRHGDGLPIRTLREHFLRGSRPNLPEQTRPITEDALRAVFVAGCAQGSDDPEAAWQRYRRELGFQDEMLVLRPITIRPRGLSPETLRELAVNPDARD